MSFLYLQCQTNLLLAVSITLVHFLSLSMTIVRIRHRWRTGRIWWDDYIVVIPWAFDFISTILLWTEYKNTDISLYTPDPEGFVYSNWFYAFTYFTIIWYVCIIFGVEPLLRDVFDLALTRFSRIGLTLSVAGIFLPGHRYRICAFIFVVVLFLLYFVSVLIGTFSCPGSPWWNLDYTHCNSTTIIVGVIIDFASDAVLVAAPLFIFWKVKFARQSDRILILALFASSIITMLAAGLFCVVWYAAALIGPDSKLLFIMTGHLQVEFPREMHM
ncbi:hypothetical protein CVT25_008369 [Psilocybe cyanescens]|uniref:Uncharacterized protein n=1 Tax=Psilocybe cyanescens TaxID=93625 RepID=A0A409WV92_PSICY|nr:hypothetical protein CVT25_008369 [Psilocybe cyanescens]